MERSSGLISVDKASAFAKGGNGDFLCLLCAFVRGDEDTFACFQRYKQVISEHVVYLSLHSYYTLFRRIVKHFFHFSAEIFTGFVFPKVPSLAVIFYPTSVFAVKLVFVSHFLMDVILHCVHPFYNNSIAQGVEVVNPPFFLFSIAIINFDCVFSL